MECAKCQGLMIEESFADGAGSIHEWRCINCGAILDAVIAQNQLRRSSRCRPALAFPETIDFRKTLSLSKIIGPCCSTPGDGKKVNLLIQNLLNSRNTVELDFDGVKLLSSSFYRAAVWSLSWSFPEDFLQSHLRLSIVTARLLSY